MILDLQTYDVRKIKNASITAGISIYKSFRMFQRLRQCRSISSSIRQSSRYSGPVRIFGRSMTDKVFPGNEIRNFLSLPPPLQISGAQDLAESLRILDDSLVPNLILSVAEKQKSLSIARKRRSELMSIPSQSNWEVGMEMGSIILCAAAGGLSVSLHFGFLSVAGIALWVNRLSTERIRERKAAAADIELLGKQISELAREIDDIVKILKCQVTVSTIE